MERAVYPVEVLELRQEGRQLRGRFPYRSMATVADRGRTRKETFQPRAFAYAVEDTSREIHLLAGHSYDRPLARKLNGSLVLEDRDDGLEFVAELPAEDEQPTYMQDLLNTMRAGLVGGISPGFRVPPSNVVPGAETLDPEPGNPAVMVRTIHQAVLFELSLVTRPAYPETEVDLRQWAPAPVPKPRVWL